MVVSYLSYHGILKEFICNILTLTYDIDIICSDTACNCFFSKIHMTAVHSVTIKIMHPEEIETKSQNLPGI